MITADTRINALIVDARMDSRSRLKQALHFEEKSGELLFHKITTAQSLHEAVIILKNNRSTDLVLIAYSFGREEIEQFIQEAAATREDSYAFIAVIEPQMQNQEEILHNIVSGIHGILCIPYSLQSLKSVADITAKVMAENADKRLLASIPLIADMMLDQARQREKLCYASAKKGKKLSDLPPLKKSKYRGMLDKIMTRFPGLAQRNLIEALTEATANSQPRAQPKYAGASEILNKKYGQAADVTEADESASESKQNLPKQNITVIHR